MAQATIDYGIDLGTTNSEIAVLQGVEPQMVPNSIGSAITPSAVWIDKRKHLRVGQDAKQRYEADPDNCDIEFKIRMGTAEAGKKCGIPHEFGSTGFGVYHSTAVAAERLKLPLKGLTFAVEGFGNVGSFAAKYLTEAGAKLVAVSDSRGCIYNKDGIDFRALEKAKKETGSVTNYKPGSVLPGPQLFELEVDVLIPAALPDSINKGNVESIKAKVVVEGANIPMTIEMEEALHKRGVLIVPDFVANAGGVISSYAEYRDKSPAEMFKLVEKKVRKNTKQTLILAKKNGIKPRDAAMLIVMERVRKAMAKRNSA